MTDARPIPRTLEYVPGALLLLDQRRLPDECAEVRCTSASEVAAAIRDMVVRGAPAIGVAAAYGVALEARRVRTEQSAGDADVVLAAVAAGGDTLRAARPTAVNLAAALARMSAAASRAAQSRATVDELIARLDDEAAAIERFEVEASHAMGRHAADLLAGRGRVLVHCNAGGLATVERGTALAAVFELHERGTLAMVYVDETRPRLQGARLTAFELGRAGVPHLLVVDSLAATLMRRGEVDAVLVGADRIAANGDVANKVGTYALAVACAHHSVPLLVVAPTSTVDLACACGDDIIIEERDASEVTGDGSTRTAPRDTKALNPAFDITPASLVHALVTERGPLSPVTGDGLAAMLEDRVALGGPG